MHKKCQRTKWKPHTQELGKYRSYLWLPLCSENETNHTHLIGRTTALVSHVDLKGTKSAKAFCTYRGHETGWSSTSDHFHECQDTQSEREYKPVSFQKWFSWESMWPDAIRLPPCTHTHTLALKSWPIGENSSDLAISLHRWSSTWAHLKTCISSPMVRFGAIPGKQSCLPFSECTNQRCKGMPSIKQLSFVHNDQQCLTQCTEFLPECTSETIPTWK